MELRRLLEQRGLVEDPGRAPVRSSVDALHLLYAAVLRGDVEAAVEALRRRSPAELEEALAIASILCRLLPEGDPEKLLACRAAGATRGSSLDRWLKPS